MIQKLANLFFRSDVHPLGEIPEAQVERITLDSRQAGPGVLFAAVRGAKADGNAYAAAALEAGAVAVLTDRPELAGTPGMVLVPSVQDAVGPLCRALHGNPDAGMRIVAVTGTNGKTSTSFLLESILEEAGLRPALSSTVLQRFPGFCTDSSMTTPDAVALWDFVSRAKAAGAASLVLEVSSHALSQERIGGIAVDAAIFTNLTRDHLDYHPTMADYFAAKSRLFTRHLRPEGVSVLNLDDEHGRLLRDHLGGRCVGFSFDAARHPDVLLSDLELDLQGLRLTLARKQGVLRLESPLMGRVFGQNLAGAAVAALEMGIAPEIVGRAVKNVRVRGRCELVRVGSFAGVVDYAHTPDALERLLEGLRPLVPGRLVCVFGCGGDRDRGKRPLMGEIASRLADRVVLTSDNPRSEDPQSILDGIEAGMTGTHEREADRHAAILRAVQGLEPGDLVVLAGKGHETTQVEGSEKRHFDDAEELKAALEKRESGSWN